MASQVLGATSNQQSSDKPSVGQPVTDSVDDFTQFVTIQAETAVRRI
jgi:hypothetical protein